MILASSPRPFWALQLPAKPPAQVQGRGLGGVANPSPKGKKEGWKRNFPTPPTPRGLVGFASFLLSDGPKRPNLP
eukprot:3657216-Pyramimonas_sp.AAC.1